ncbi:1-acyl-sn-glycerol-3-phosphate acyltransferase [Kribbella pratensis]|uniref:1-acyl-sn-glycerol-3-phosphate acyltransferase n=1 Tax=Kribbella pratensis TaxID=2512112 RepID=A0ABY2FC64_9ACTN|nr:lysophospholipid acyltransferase family protein [Kribbella pratensis]TDW88169.1 1-acyl-sn-glycerol-3-phosphate acyltransferase [Kribbella pratensis]
MADADVIPIGSGGRPGRGSGRRTTPSAAARALAGGRAKKKGRVDERADADVTAATRAAKNGPSAGRRSVEAAGAGETPADAVPDVDGPEAPAGSDFAGLEQAVRGLFGEDGERRVAEWLAFLRRRLTGEYELDEFGYDSDLTDQVLLPMLRPMVEKWFRVEVRGIENIPSDGSALIVANHSGTMPLDGLVTQVVVADHTGRPLRTLAADLVFQTPFVGELSRKGGATLANNDDAERLLRQGNLVGVWPEGFKGLGKPFAERYKLQRFGRGGFVSAAMRTGVPIVPCSIVGAEEIYPLVGNIASLARLLGVPYIPVTPFFPLLGPLGLIPLPSKWLIEFGEPIRTDDFPDGAADDPMLVFNVTDQVRETIQQTLYTLLMQRRSVFF